MFFAVVGEFSFGPVHAGRGFVPEGFVEHVDLVSEHTERVGVEAQPFVLWPPRQPQRTSNAGGTLDGKFINRRFLHGDHLSRYVSSLILEGFAESFERTLMDTAALLREIEGLEASSERLDYWLTIFIAAVVIGLVIEVFEVIKGYRQAMAAYREGVIKSPDKPSKRELAFHLLGPVLITLGVAGELGAHVKAGEINTRLRNASNRIVAIMDLERARLQSALSPRRLSDEQRKTLAAVVAKYPGIAVDVFITDQEDDASSVEARDFGYDMAEALGHSKGEGVLFGHNCLPWPVVGVIVESVQDGSRDRYAAGEILTALQSLNIGMIRYVAPIQFPSCSAFSGSKLGAPPAKIVIVIGKRPSPILKIEEPRAPVTPQKRQ